MKAGAIGTRPHRSVRGSSPAVIAQQSELTRGGGPRTGSPSVWSCARASRRPRAAAQDRHIPACAGRPHIVDAPRAISGRRRLPPMEWSALTRARLVTNNFGARARRRLQASSSSNRARLLLVSAAQLGQPSSPDEGRAPLSQPFTLRNRPRATLGNRCWWRSLRISRPARLRVSTNRLLDGRCGLPQSKPTAGQTGQQQGQGQDEIERCRMACLHSVQSTGCSSCQPMGTTAGPQPQAPRRAVRSAHSVPPDHRPPARSASCAWSRRTTRPWYPGWPGSRHGSRTVLRRRRANRPGHVRHGVGQNQHLARARCRQVAVLATGGCLCTPGRRRALTTRCPRQRCARTRSRAGGSGSASWAVITRPCGSMAWRDAHRSPRPGRCAAGRW